VSGTAALIWGMIFRSVGFGYFIYGRKQKAIVPLIVGIALCVVPYFIANEYVLVGIGTVLVAIPYFVRV
jgi:hypothetical protein